MSKRLGELLIESHAISEQTCTSAAYEATSNGTWIGKILVHEYGVDEDTVYRALAVQAGVRFVDSFESASVTDTLQQLSHIDFSQRGCVPMHIDDNRLALLTDNALDLDMVATVEALSGYLVETVLTSPTRLAALRERLFHKESVFKHSAGRIATEYQQHQSRDDSNVTLEEIRKRTESEPVVKMVNLLFNEAISRRATDIHIEPGRDNAFIRFRIDGMLRHYMDLDKWMYPPVTSRIKILADLDIAEKRTPQDGRIRFAGREGEFDFRVSTLPTHYGEKSVLRILKHDPKLLEVCNLGIQGREQQTLLSAIEKPQGMIFVTGPTGSGKTSTLFACLNKIRHKDINITTIENPIEYKLENINQVQINEKAGITFASALRSILRQDPDVILVGEIRDRETAEIAIQASQTGHLVLSTLHTNDAVSAITRLRDLGIPSFMISSALLAIIAQRLVRILCPACRREEQLEGEVYERWLRLIGEQFPDRIYTAQGCPRCSNTGFLGRTGIFETVGANDRLRSLLSDEINESRLKQQLQQQGMRTMIYNGIGKIEQGITTPQELLRVVMAEELTA